jgi:putative flippase GtrA
MPNWQKKESEKVMGKEKKRELIRTVKFVLFSISAGVIQILSFTLLNELMTWPYWPSYLISITLSVLWNFTLNRRFTFKSANNVPIAMAQTAAFYLVFTPLSTLLGNYLVESLLWNEYLVTAINMISNFVLEYLFQRFVVFRNSLDTNDLAKKEQNAN